MDDYEEVPPDTVSISLTEDGIVVEYTDGREVFYRGVPEPVDSPHLTTPGKDTHVLVTDETQTSGIMMYVNERRTDGDILRGTGVGRVLLDEGEESTLFPGVAVRGGNLRDEIVLEEGHDGRVFIFEEDQFTEQSYELVVES